MTRDTGFRRTMADDYFHDMYARSDDPWGFAERFYERRKYALTMAALRADHYERVFEPGCSIGVLSDQLAARSDQLLCTDLSPRAVELATQRLAHHGGRVQVRTADLVTGWPDETFDLIVLSEVLYYLDPVALDALLTRLPRSLRPRGEVIAVHWRRKVEEYPQSGDDVHDRLLHGALSHAGGYRDADLRLDVFTADAGPSVAQRENLVP
ncbi:class I SAM-dependent DNA methyltransferase [Gordonia sp. NPDC062954]|uniref:Class I SAM-dependent methyltransferase n=1 Tax=Gordonia aquimaris TaxID=2984863 RepID=A0A9X3D7S8_9ACTN|nr:class I SAM-dependent methyltransferase [Gordonia aquimaris]MCX2966759.1 class I SAM-dependent methyltransferase [Gordonia aquimaris]